MRFKEKIKGGRMHRKILMASAGLCVIACWAEAAPALAQGTAGPGVSAAAEVSEVIVTARKRAESDMAVPVVVTALSAEVLAKQGATDIYKISQLVPQLIVSQGPSSTGGVIALRGINSGTGVSTDQTVALNLDGIAVSNATALRIGQFDLRQVEVLKGPQALFFGKNSPAGVISFTSEGPTPDWSGYAKTGYEFTADEWRSEAAIGGPLGHGLGIRLAGYYGTMKGYFRNELPPNYAPGLVFGPRSSRVPNRDEWGGRLTLAYEPTDTFLATLKMAMAQTDGTSASSELQRISCPLGFHGGVEEVPGRPFTNCKLDRTTNPLGTVSPAIAALDRAFAGGDYDKNKQYVNTLNIDYKINPSVTLTSISGYYENQYRGLNLNGGPVPNVITSLPVDRRELSQEVRLASNLAGRFNFTIGGFYQDAFLFYSPNIYRGPGAPGAALGVFNASRYKIRGETKSVFAQASFKITEQLELAGGARYTDEEKRQTVVDKSGVNKTALLTPSELDVTDLSPEVTLTYRPSEDLTLFGAFKEGFKSGGFVAATTALYTVPTTNAYGPEHIRGGEAGLKARLLNRSLRVNAAVYDYKIKGLQVSAFDPVRGSVFTQNATSATIRGIEADFAYRPDVVRGLSINGAAGYNHARYGKYAATCYTGQTIAQGCTLLPSAGRFTSQNLGGTPLTFAPDWSGNLGGLYEFAVGAGLRAEVGGGLRFNSSYFAAAEHSPESRAKAATFVDAQARLISERGNWEIALIGRNLTDELRPVVALDVAFTGTPSGLTTGTRGDVQALANRPREIMVQFTIRR